MYFVRLRHAAQVRSFSAQVRLHPGLFGVWPVQGPAKSGKRLSKARSLMALGQSAARALQPLSYSAAHLSARDDLALTAQQPRRSAFSLAISPSGEAFCDLRRPAAPALSYSGVRLLQHCFPAISRSAPPAAIGTWSVSTLDHSASSTVILGRSPRSLLLLGGSGARQFRRLSLSSARLLWRVGDRL